MKQEYRVVWKREGCSKRTKKFAQKKYADRFVRLLSDPEPWKAYGYKGDDYVCCHGERDECGCGGMTYAESFNQKREGLPKLLEVKIEQREVGSWETPAEGGEGKA